MKTHWNYGYTTEAMKAILDFAKVNLGIRKVAGSHAKENLVSAKVIKNRGLYMTGMTLDLMLTVPGSLTAANTC